MLNINIGLSVNLLFTQLDNSAEIKPCAKITGQPT